MNKLKTNKQKRTFLKNKGISGITNANKKELNKYVGYFKKTVRDLKKGKAKTLKIVGRWKMKKVKLIQSIIDKEKKVKKDDEPFDTDFVPFKSKSGFFNFSELKKKVDDIIGLFKVDRSKAFTITIKSFKNNQTKTFSFNNWYQFSNWFKGIENEATASVDSSNFIKYNNINKDLFAFISMELDFIEGGCNRNNKKVITYQNIYNKFEFYSPISKDDNCGIKCIEKLLELKIKASKIRKKYNIGKGKININDIKRIYDDHKNIGVNHLPLMIIDEEYGGIIELDKYNYLYLKNKHYYIIQKAIRKEIYKNRRCKRGLLFWDLETRKTDKYNLVGDNKSYILKDTICHIWYKPLKTKKWEHKVFTTNKDKTSVRQFNDWLIKQAYCKKFYNCIAHNGSKFDNYFFIGSLTKKELLLTDLQLRGYGIIGIQFYNHLFKDSCCFMTDSLDNLCKDFRIKNKKITEFKYNNETLTNKNICFYKPDLSFNDFMKLEKNEPEFWKHYNEYCKYDCISLQEIWTSFVSRTNELISKISPYLLRQCNIMACNTIGSLTKKIVDCYNIKFANGYRKELFKFTNNDDKYNFLCCSGQYLNDSKFKRGGISHCNQGGLHKLKVRCCDITSQYPASLINMRIPVGNSKFVDKYKKDMYGFYHIRNLKFNTNLTLKPICETGKISLNWNTGKLVKEAHLDTFMIEYLKEKYGLYDFDVIKGLVSKKYISGDKLFGKYVKILFEEKEKQDKLKFNEENNIETKEKYNPSYRAVIKLFLNALTGKLVEDSRKYFGLTYTDEDTDKNIMGVNIEKEMKDKINKYLPCGLMCYSYSKRLLFEYIDLLPNRSKDVIHIETDSIYYHDKHFGEWKENCENYEGNYPVVFGDDEKGDLGSMKVEGISVDDNYFLGKKFYYFHCKDGKKIKEKKKIKGIPLKTIDKNGNDVLLVDKQLYKDVYSGMTIKKEFSTMTKVLYGDVKISTHYMTRTIKPAMKYKLYN